MAAVRAGQVVNAHDTLFEIVDPKRLWVEAVGRAGEEETKIGAAFAIDAEGHSLPPLFIGQAPALRQQITSLQFRVANPYEALTIGASIKAIVQRGAPTQGVIVPVQAIVRGANALPQIWSKPSAESFKALPVRTEPLDGTRVVVEAGIEPGTRFVTEGAEFINQIQ